LIGGIFPSGSNASKERSIMAKLRVGINGFGRIGRLALRAGLKHPAIEVVGINDLYPPENLAYLFKYDSTHGVYPGTVVATDEGIVIDDQLIPCTAIKNPTELPWAKAQVDYVIEATGLFTSYETAGQHLQAGAKRVVISAPTSDSALVKTLLMGVNHEQFEPASDRVISNASCTTNCLAPLAKVIHDAIGIEEGLMTTVHAMTATQPTVDGPSRKDMRGGRGAAQNIIPASTGAAKAVGLVLPELNGKLTGMSFRVPTPDVSVVDLTFRSARPTTYAEICEAVRSAANGSMRLVLAYTEDAVVSSDFQDDPHSCIFDATAGMALNDRFFKVVAWYDNEWGYANRIIDLMLHMADREGILAAQSAELVGV
jgi:glyceraldehyde 3-phosphate dehydrogenase